MIEKLAAMAIRRLPSDIRLQLTNRLFAAASDDWKYKNGVFNMVGAINNLARNGFSPRSIVDIGAYSGEWTKSVSSTFPLAELLMIEAQPQKQERLQSVAANIGARAHVLSCLLGSGSRDAVVFHLMETGSSIMEEDTSFDRMSITLPMTTLDVVTEGQHLKSPIFLKLDVQGYELEILKGGAKTLGRSEVVLMEVSLLEYNKGAPSIREVIDFMWRNDFVAYDICGVLRRETDLAVFQIDIIFTRTDSELRARRKFWLREP